MILRWYDHRNPSFLLFDWLVNNWSDVMLSYDGSGKRIAEGSDCFKGLGR